MKPQERVLKYLTNPRPERDQPEGVAPSEWGKVSEGLSEVLIGALVEPKWPIVITGSTGLGKSCAMACIYKSWRNTALWCCAGELLSRILSCRTSPTKSVLRRLSDGRTVEESEIGIKGRILRTNLVCFDDVGIREPTESQRELFKHLVDLRLCKPTIFSTNLDHNQFADLFGMPIVSRVFCGTVIRITGTDRRFSDVKIQDVETN